MRTLLTPLLALAGAASAGAQSELLHVIPQPANAINGWASMLAPLPDLDGDGVLDLAASRREHGSGRTRVFSGRTGSPLLVLDQGPMVLFFGRGVLGVDDLNDDGVPEVVNVGFASLAFNSLDGRIVVQSGADGSLLASHAAPAGVRFLESRVLTLDDADGDGVQDVLVRTQVPTDPTAPRLQLFSSATGQPLYTGIVEHPDLVVMQDPARTSDHDGDGVADFLVGTAIGFTSQRSVQVRSGATGEVLRDLDMTAHLVGVVTGNGDPLVSIADLDGDGLEDIAIGGVFDGYVGLFSSATGELLRQWTCPGFTCLGGLLFEIPDRSGDGHPDLLVLEGALQGFGDGRLLQLDPVSGTKLMVESVPHLQSGYGFNDPVLPLPGIHAEATSYAQISADGLSLELRALADPQGARFCASGPNSTGASAKLHLLGDEPQDGGPLRLVATDVPVGQPGLFFFGPQQTRLPLGNGFLCVGGDLHRLPVTFAEEHGLLVTDLQPASGPAPADLLLPGTTWNFQGWYRDPAAAGNGATSDLTDGVELSF